MGSGEITEIQKLNQSLAVSTISVDVFYFTALWAHTNIYFTFIYNE